MAAIALCALVARLLIIAHSNGGADLRIYVYFSRLALHGANPFATFHGGAISNLFGNSPPVEVALFAGVLAIHDSPTTLRVLFALTDVAIILLIGFRYPRPRSWRAAFMVFYALNPFVLFSWVVFSEDKGLLFLWIIVLVLALEESRVWLSWVATTALVVLKFLGALAVPVLALHTLFARRWRALTQLGVFLCVSVFTNLLWFPRSLDAFSRRDVRLAINPPIHASPTIVLSRLGIYSPVEAKVLTVAAIAVVVGLFVLHRIDIREAVIWSLLGGYIFLPDDAFNRLLLITLPFMLIIELSLLRWLAVWFVTSTVAIAGLVATRGVPHIASPIGSLLSDAFGREGSLRHVFWMNIFTVLILVYYFADRADGASNTKSFRASMAVGNVPP